MRVRQDDDELQEAIDTLDIESWLDREGVRYRSARGASGTQLNLRECPCCGNTNYKVYLNADTGLGNCFHGDCEEKFNKWKFISRQLGITMREAAEHIKQVAREQGWRPARKTAVAVNTHSAALALPESFALPHNGRNLKYLDNRNISGDVSRYFSLRFSQRGVFAYRDDEGSPRQQNYANRIIIPIFDLEGDLVSFQGRDITGTSDKKYLFPPGFASTGTHLYNGQNAVGAARIVINEGVFDVAATKIALDGEMALRDVVPIGSFGKHLSHGDEDSQLARIMTLKEKGLKQATLMWDGEKQAIKDAVAAAKMLKGCGILTRVALLPKGKDPNEIAASEVRSAFWRATVIDDMTATKLTMMAEKY